jgi:hypothetical protein
VFAFLDDAVGSRAALGMINKETGLGLAEIVPHLHEMFAIGAGQGANRNFACAGPHARAAIEPDFDLPPNSTSVNVSYYIHTCSCDITLNKILFDLSYCSIYGSVPEILRQGPALADCRVDQ